MGSFFGCYIICIVLGVGIAVLHDVLKGILKAIKNHNTQISTGSEFCDQPPEKGLNNFCSCDTVPS